MTTVAVLRHQSLRLLQRCFSLVTLGMQVLQQQLEDRGANQEKKHTGRDLEAELLEIGEVLEGVEEERDALQQQVDRLEASAFQSANQARQVMLALWSGRLPFTRDHHSCLMRLLFCQSGRATLGCCSWWLVALSRKWTDWGPSPSNLPTRPGESCMLLTEDRHPCLMRLPVCQSGPASSGCCLCRL